ncbi:hypothetical protein [Williamsia muralis]|uniref:Uncharacterized protein n=1 Tax=Williamsia marianensis TaxID=85044 RepID=A0ABU4EZ91_WILMA|nr:hypothetical protein [Williamsia muralis]MDV7136568.1 hypothetical protein [Williamsia muralis]
MPTAQTRAVAGTATNRGLRAVATVAAALTGLLAFAGAIGVAGGGADFGKDVEQRLPWESPVLAGIALALVVGVPTTLAAFTLWRLMPQAAVTTLIAGVMLVAWIAVQIAVIREFNPLQVVFGLVGLLLIATGWHFARSDTLK